MKEHGQSVQFITFAKTQFSASVSEGDWDPHSIRVVQFFSRGYARRRKDYSY